MSNQDYKNAALTALKGNWTPAVLATVVLLLISAALGGGSAFFEDAGSTSYEWVLGGCTLVSFLVVVPMEIGYYYSYVLLLKEGDNSITNNMFSLGFSGWLHKIATMIVMSLAVLVGIILLVVPGIILSFAYAMVPYLLVKEPDLSVTETLKRSRHLMNGHKLDYFLLELSFIGWILLGILTLGIGYIWLMPYMIGSVAAFWEDVYNNSSSIE